VTWDEKDDAYLGGSDDGPPAENLIPPVLGLIGIGVLVYLMSVFGMPDSPSSEALSHCAAMTDGHARLACYDQLASPQQPAKGALAPVGAYQREK
jgi:hypothetical protein